MVIKILGTYPLESDGLSDDRLYKIALWDIYCLIRSDFQWLLPFFWPKETDEPSIVACALAIGYSCFGGIKAVKRSLNSPTLLSVANVLRTYEKHGGHPLEEGTLFTLMLLVNGTPYEDVLRDEKEREVLELCQYKHYLSSRERQNALQRAKHRVRRAGKMLEKIGINVKHVSPETRALRKWLQAGELN
jgi:hypothetical protein